MIFKLSYDIASIAILVSIFVVHKINNNKLMIQNKMFAVVCRIALVAAIADIFDVTGNTYINIFPQFVDYLISYVYFLSLNSIPFGYALYIISLRDSNGFKLSTRERILIYVPYIILWLFVLSNVFTQAVFYYDAQGVYHRGKYQAILYVISYYFMIYGAVYATYIKNKLTKVHVYSTYCFIIMGCGCALIQFFVPNMYISVFGSTINILVVFMAILHPDEGIDKNTGLLNHTALGMMLNELKDKEVHDTLLLINIDDVKFLNMAIGVKRTDKYLEVIGKYIRTLDVKACFYLNGGLFAAWMSGNDIRRNHDMVYDISKRFEQSWIYDDEPLYMNCRILELCVPEEMQRPEKVEMYREYLNNMKTKDSRHLKGSDTSLSTTKRKIEVCNAIKRAMENNNFEVFYQPIYSVEQQKITSAEALLRLNDPEIGYVPPDEFIVIAEQEGWIVKIGEMVFENVCKFIKDTPLLYYGIEYIEVNLSVVQCLQESLSEKLIYIMNKYDIDRKWINLEITETAANSSPKMLIRNMNKLYEDGVTFSLDDYGTGYSNISSIMELPLDMIKFDKTIIDTIYKSEKGRILFIGSVTMIKKMQLKIVAEGVETVEQKEMLEKSGVDYLQGYFFSKPVPAEPFLEYVKKYNTSV